jgi:hypothetical protein
VSKYERILHEVKLSTVLDFYASAFSAPKGKQFIKYGAIAVVAVDTAKDRVVYALTVEDEESAREQGGGE